MPDRDLMRMHTDAVHEFVTARSGLAAAALVVAVWASVQWSSIATIDR